MNRRDVSHLVLTIAVCFGVAPASTAGAAVAPRVWLGALDGGVFTLGSAPFYGSLGSTRLPSPIIGIAARPQGDGYWMTSLAGDIYAFGAATSHGSLHGIKLNQPIVDIVPTPSGNGYWLAAADGGVFTFGDATFHGSLGSVHLNKPVTGIVSTPTGLGYWMVASDGGVFTFGDARFRGSLGGTSISSAVVAMTARSDGGGYWLVRRDGRVNAFGNATALGDATGIPAVAVAIVRSSANNGYWVTFADGSVRAFGDAVHVSLPAMHLNGQIVGIATPWASVSGFGLTLIDYLRALSQQTVPLKTWVGAHEVALTFDDGPTEYTQAVVNALRAAGVSATFFTVGYEAAARPDLLRVEAAAGMSVQAHSWDHPDLTRLSPAAIDDELTRSVNAVISAIGTRPRCFRPPYGSTNNTVVNEAAKLGLTQILWNVDPSDYLRPGTGTIVSRVLAAATGRGLVVGIHDGGGDRSQTVAAIPAMVAGLRARGYTFVKLCG